MIYVMATCRIAPENVKEFMKIFQDEWEWGKYGRKLAGQWITAIGQRGPREITDLWVFDDLAHRQREQEAVAKDEAVAAVDQSESEPSGTEDAGE